ncbi:hypothetical protein [Jiulongibacter sediminis]|uniref:Uncharacterized protein n=1 Tax=Jiulongibacter sediminis TaxID=1605367 RepID=A0A0P7C4G4_9BACT|nr:hypothetical protein [Jiulongibacter sediminis]KPM46794.1 hypothetical protein AFM12_18770 [Jiulongibacter sediminis]TBX21699.1 hypothetical protein TK44_18775 [Jiulongibacter sediminis]
MKRMSITEWYDAKIPQAIQVRKTYYPNYDYRQYVQKKSRTNCFWMLSTFALLGILIIVLWDKVESLIRKVVVRWYDPGTTENKTTLKKDGLGNNHITNRKPTL